MSLESGNFIIDLVTTNPEGTDPKSQGDDHLRLLKHVLRTQFSGFTEGIPITKTESQINAMLIAGNFGLGGVPVAINEDAINNADLPTGFYYVTPQGLGLLPGNQYCYMIYLDNVSAGYAWRFLVGANGGECYGQVKVAGSWQALGTQWDGNNTPKQVGMFDNRAACMLTTGSFGLGVTQPAGANANLANAPFAGVANNGRWFGNSWVGQPPEQSAATPAIVELIAYSTVYAKQTFHCLNNGATYVRNMNNGVWSNFQLQLVLGAQSSGNPGYQVINRICHQWGVFAAGLINGGAQTVALPQTLTTPWVAFANAQASAASHYYEAKVTALTTSTLTLGFSSDTGSNSGPISWHAIGLV